MKVVQINTFPYKATGSLMLSIHNNLLKSGDESYVVWGRGREAETKNELNISCKPELLIHGAISRVFDCCGFASNGQTKELLRYLDTIKPDIVHLHNIHGYYLNVEMLFNYFSKRNIKVVWTFHDCWPMTGHCVYFDAIDCKRWKTGCYKCPQKREYPASYIFDNSRNNWIKKKEIFNSVDITIVTVSKWLKSVVEQSFFNNNEIVHIDNGISPEVFKPLGNCAETKERYNVGGKFLVLGVASEWTERKGLNDFIKLSMVLPKDKYGIILVGLTSKQIENIKKIAPEIIGLHRTSNREELIQLYTSADVFFNSSIEETMGMTTVEAIFCGATPIVYDATALPEIMEGCEGLIAPKNDVTKVAEIVKQICEENGSCLLTNFSKERFYESEMTSKYRDLYIHVLSGRKMK